MDLMDLARKEALHAAAACASEPEGLGYGHVPNWMQRPAPGVTSATALPGTQRDAQTAAEARLSSNPKDAIGRTKVPIHLIPPAASIAMAHVFDLGAKKYGAYNWRDASVAATVYVSAAQRHLAAFMDGEFSDPESGQPHIAHVAACMAILIDAFASGNIVDDRPKAGPAPLMLKGAHFPLHDHNGLAAQPPKLAYQLDAEERRTLAAEGPPKGIFPAPPPVTVTPRKPFMWYIATPYQACPDGKGVAYYRAVDVLRELTRRNVVAFCPIAHNHEAGAGLSEEHEFWMGVDRPFMDRCDGLLVMKQPGWGESRGISEEIDTFQAAGKLVMYGYDPAGWIVSETTRAAHWDDLARNLHAVERGEG